MIPLSLADIDKNLIIRRIGGSPEVRNHLENLGLNVGGEIRIINVSGENVIVKVRETRVALSNELARKIMV